MARAATAHDQLAATVSLRPLHSLGVQGSMLADGSTEFDKAVKAVLSNTIASWSPFTGPDPVVAFTPTLALPFVEMKANENFMGNPIVPEDTYGTKAGIPASEQFFERSNSQGAEALAQYLKGYRQTPLETSLRKG